ncbi:hypothetical protein BDY21DRAFT_331003 [Lineolata rhizophorae]|uniref:Uncharacterized protein n=1 Tax=Lineolata rhizophorae TaxID=578093 RepID=A0A6A6PEV5_9PEZI|nr:hypothetical protein BDY21DRAFT_331003 [Lineolata rhizophorae]
MHSILSSSNRQRLAKMISFTIKPKQSLAQRLLILIRRISVVLFGIGMASGAAVMSRYDTLKLFEPSGNRADNSTIIVPHMPCNRLPIQDVLSHLLNCPSTIFFRAYLPNFVQYPIPHDLLISTIVYAVCYAGFFWCFRYDKYQGYWYSGAILVSLFGKWTGLLQAHTFFIGLTPQLTALFIFLSAVQHRFIDSDERGKKTLAVEVQRVQASNIVDAEMGSADEKEALLNETGVDEKKLGKM